MYLKITILKYTYMGNLRNKKEQTNQKRLTNILHHLVMVGRRGPQEGISAFIRTGRDPSTPSPCRVGTQGEAGHRQARTRALAGLRIGLRLDLGLLSPQIRERTNVLSEPPRLWWL